MKKKILSIALALTLMLALVPTASAAGETLTFTAIDSDGVEYATFSVTNAVLSNEYIDGYGYWWWDGPVYHVLDGSTIRLLDFEGDRDNLPFTAISYVEFFDPESGQGMNMQTVGMDMSFHRLFYNLDQQTLNRDSYGWEVMPAHYELYTHEEIEAVIGLVHIAGHNFRIVEQLSAPPAPPAPPPAPSQTVSPTASTVIVNGQPTAFEAYNIDGFNYFKLRDLAYALGGSNKQFAVGWDGAANAISLTSGGAYEPVGGEMAQGDGTAKTANPTTSRVFLDGRELSLTAYNIGGNNFFRLRDLMRALDIGVTWDGTTSTIGIDTSISYTE